MKELVVRLYAILSHLGGFGLLGVGVLDSSIFVMPLANDLFLIAMTARRPILLPYYAVMASAGSVLGCTITAFVSRKGGEKGLERYASRRRLAYVKRRVKKHAGWALAFAALMPPPFPFTAFVAAAGTFQYPYKKLLAVIAIFRFARFSIEGLLAVFFGPGILKLAEEPAVQYAMFGLIVVSIGASAVSIYSWVRGSRSAAGQR